MKKKKTIKIEVEITFEYDTDHPRYYDEGVTEAIAMDLAIRPNPHTIEDGVKLLKVCNKEKDYHWL